MTPELFLSCGGELRDIEEELSEYATVICPNFHFSVSPHVPFLNLLFEKIAYSNEYLLDEIGVDTAENELLQVLFKIIQYYSIVSLGAPRRAC